MLLDEGIVSKRWRQTVVPLRNRYFALSMLS